MKKSVLQFISLLLVTVLVMSLFAGCGETPETKEEPVILQPNADPIPVDEPEEEPEEEVPEVIEVRITELMPANKTCLLTAEGKFSDWIELENLGAEACELGGCWLSDNPEVLEKWCVPELSLEPGERVIIFCDNEESDSGELHANFSLDKKGETLCLSDKQGNLLQTVSYEELESDEALWIFGESTRVTRQATPGYENSIDGYEAFLAANESHGKIIINEVVSINEKYHFMHGGYFDWFELKNVSDEEVSLKGWKIADSLDSGDRKKLKSATIAPGETLIVFCVGADNYHKYTESTVRMGIDTAGDQLYLYDADGQLVDRVGIYDLPLRGSVGRVEGENGLFYFTEPTPEKQNVGGSRFYSEKPEATVTPGIYNDVENVTVELFAPGTVYYTTDGTMPTESSEVYSGPITLTATGSIRAIALEEGKLPSRCSTFSYIINENHTLPVVFISCNKRSFGAVYATVKYSDMYCDANVSYFGEDGSFSADCKVKLHGASSRRVWNKKNLKLVFSDMYGGDLQYDLFGTGSVEGIHSFTLRGGPAVGMTLLRDEMAAELANRVSVCDPLALDYKYSVLYVDGEYRGVYAIREAYSEKYAATHLDDEEENMTVCRAPVYDDQSKDLHELLTFIATKNMGNEEYYAQACERMDMQSLANWMCLEAYLNNNDPTGNIRYCRSSLEGSKWEIMFFDLDQSMANTNATWQVILNANSQIGSVCFNLSKSPMFRQLLLETASQLIQNGLSPQLMKDLLSDIAETIEPEMQRDLRRWGENYKSYRDNLEWQLNKFTDNRTETWLRELMTITRSDKETMHLYFPDYY